MLVQAGVPLAALANAGAARVSTGSLLFRLALGAIETAAGAVRDGAFTPPPGTPTYDAVASLS